MRMQFHTHHALKDQLPSQWMHLSSAYFVVSIMALCCRGLKLDYILNTHHHWDHTGGNEELKKKFSCTIVGPKADEGRIPGIDTALGDGESWQFGDLKMEVFDTPGHTRGHITLWFPEVEALFPGMPSRLPMHQMNCFSYFACAVHFCSLFTWI